MKKIVIYFFILIISVVLIVGVCDVVRHDCKVVGKLISSYNGVSYYSYAVDGKYYIASRCSYIPDNEIVVRYMLNNPESYNVYGVFNIELLVIILIAVVFSVSFLLVFGEDYLIYWYSLFKKGC